MSDADLVRALRERAEQAERERDEQIELLTADRNSLAARVIALEVENEKAREGYAQRAYEAERERDEARGAIEGHRAALAVATPAAAKLRAERDEAVALLRECRPFVAAFPGQTTTSLLARLDALLERQR